MAQFVNGYCAVLKVCQLVPKSVFCHIFAVPYVVGVS
jgi:hypothetical protein